ncbi:polyribonucleotide nucleotidyltransferase [Candidatus Uhrbacteria bacterium]|nr:polyribonucleotide nucleotidyltransferase [Candidatus Uhrbacteria bacterium]
MAIQKFSTEWGGRELTIETGRLAKQTNGSCTVQYGGTVVLATAVISKSLREGIDYFPLMVDFEEKLYAAGKIKGSRFIKRETRPSDDAILTARLIDRSLRPLFDERIRNDVQVILTTLSFDTENDVDIVSLVAASAALAISDIPWDGPIAGVRVGQIPSDDGTKKEWVLNPTYDARAKSVLDLVVAGTPEKVLMIEAGAHEVDEPSMVEAIRFGQKHMRSVLDLILEVQKAMGAQKRVITDEEDPTVREEKLALKNLVNAWVEEHVRAHLLDGKKLSKTERKEALEVLKTSLELYLQENSIGKDKRKTAFGFFEKAVEREVTRAILEEGKRVDGRALDEIRPLGVEVGLLPRTHGSAVFSRGDTQVLSVVTLGSPSDEQIIEGLEDEEKKRYMHHYNFPPYSVGEVSPLRGAGRREVGHGMLAEKALVPMLPNKETFPYVVRVVSEVLSSNGSSSMGSTCGSSLALMDAGVPIKKPVAGIAMGLASDGTGKWKVITDLQDLEDGRGGMDFKIAGTADGITAIQLDTKTSGLAMEIVEQTFTQGRDARLRILEAMAAVIPAPRPELSQYAPRIITLRIKPDMIRVVIGPGGKMINEIIDKTGVDMDIEDDGLVFITSTNAEKAQEAVEWVKRLTREVVVGEIFEGKVTRIMEFGAFVEILPRQEGLVHISELAPYRVNRVEDIVKIGQTIPVKVIEIDDMGRTNLSLKQTDYKDYPPAPTGGEQAPHGGFGGGRPPRRGFGGNGGGHGGPRRPRF